MYPPAAAPPLPSADDSSAVSWLQALLAAAWARGASDLHLEPYEHSYRVRLRIDGQLQPVAAPPASLKERIASRIKVLARLDIAEKRLPQDGQFRLELPAGQTGDLRVSTLPTLFGEKIVIRLLPTDNAQVQLDALGLEPLQLQQLRDAIQRPQGMVLVTGPTGSGKTITLYSCLQALNRPDVNIASVEDPCEIRLEGINQVHLHEKAGLDYASVLRAFLRQDPDILMVGEIRDLATADTALKAAQTGHLVLSTLHTLDAPSALTRLQQMGVPPYQLAASISLVVAQRLVRQLCRHCRQPQPLHASQWLAAGLPETELASRPQAWQPVGCAHCHLGYRGRTGIFQLMPIGCELQDAMLQQAVGHQLQGLARQLGMRSLRQAGLRKVLQGETSLQEVLHATTD